MAFTKLKKHLAGTLLDKGKPSFGRTYSLPFLLSLWLVSTVGGALLIVKGNSIIEWMFAMAAIAAGMYAGSKGLSTLDTTIGRKYEGLNNVKTDKSTGSGSAETGPEISGPEGS